MMYMYSIKEEDLNKVFIFFQMLRYSRDIDGFCWKSKTTDLEN